MPGVPTSRGCVACRHVKKRCSQGAPCTRCKRLGIHCVGSGERRFKFVQQSAPQHGQDQVILRSPSNETTGRTKAFVAVLEVEDGRYDVNAWCSFLKDIPRRLGTNAALDAASTALTSSVSFARSRQGYVQGRIAYGNALHALRHSIANADQAYAPETLSAIYLVTICQGWLSHAAEESSIHVQAMAWMIDAATSRPWTTEFETQLISTIAVSTIVKTLFNPEVQLYPWLDRLLERLPPPATDAPFPSLALASLARLPRLAAQPSLHLDEIRQAYAVSSDDTAKLRRITFSATTTPGSTLHHEMLTSYGLSIARNLLLNHLLHAATTTTTTTATTPRDGADLLPRAASVLTDAAIVFGEEAQMYRPIGAFHAPICLTMAWAMTDDETQRGKIDGLMRTFAADFPIWMWPEQGHLLRARLDAIW